MSVNYLSFQVQNLNIGSLLSSIFGLKNPVLINIFNFLPKIDYVTVIMGGITLERTDLLKPITKMYNNQKITSIAPLYRYADCSITFLGKTVKLMYGVSLTSFEFGLRLT
jgi:hypothetical protein